MPRSRVASDLGAELERYRPALLRMASAWCTTDAEDVVQDAILRALRHAKQYRGRSLLRWMSAVVRTAALDRARRERRTPVPIGLDASGAADWSESAVETSMAVRAALGAMSREARVMVGLHARGYTYREIAERCGCTVHRVRHSLHRARAAARRTSLSS